MAPDPQAHDRIYRALKSDLARGQYPPGMRIEIQRVAELNRSSATPVREVLARLAGEGLVEMQVHGGFCVARLDAVRLAPLYRWNAMILSNAIALTIPANMKALPVAPLSASSLSADDSATYIGALFLALAQAADNAEIERVVRLTNARLSFVRAAEFTIIRNVRQEISGFEQAVQVADFKGLRRRIAAYHVRRLEQIDRIIGTFPKWQIQN